MVGWTEPATAGPAGLDAGAAVRVGVMRLPGRALGWAENATEVLGAAGMEFDAAGR